MTEKTQGKKSKAVPGQVQSLVRSLKVLKTLALQSDGMSLSEVSKAVGLPVSTTHRLLTTLEGERFVRANPSSGGWTIGAEAFKTGLSFLQTRDIAVLAHPLLRGLALRWSETASLYVEAGGELVCISQVESKQMMRAVARVGGRVAMHCTSAGKSILSQLPAGEVSAVIAQHGLPRKTTTTLTSRANLDGELLRIRQQGWALDDEELVEGVRCCAAVVLDHERRPVGAISLSGPVSRMRLDMLSTIGADVAATAQELSREMGYGGPDIASDRRQASNGSLGLRAH